MRRSWPAWALLVWGNLAEATNPTPANPLGESFRLPLPRSGADATVWR